MDRRSTTEEHRPRKKSYFLTPSFNSCVQNARYIIILIIMAGFKTGEEAATAHPIRAAFGPPVGYTIGNCISALME